MRFFLAILATLLFAAAAADAAPAGRLRLHLYQVATGPVVNETVTYRSPSMNDIDLTAATAMCTGTELITVAQSGGIVTQVWPQQDVSLGPWYKNELLADQGLTLLTIADGQADTVNAGRLTVSCSGGTYIIQVNVATPELNTWKFGNKTTLSQGGFPLYYLPGTVTDWTVDASSSANWRIFNRRVMPQCTPNTGTCPTEGVTTNYGTGNAAMSCTPGSTCPSTVLLNNATLGISRTITMNFVANQRDFAPTPSWFTNSGANSQLLTAMATSSKACGDTMMGEGSAEFPQVYGINTGSFGFTASANPTCSTPPTVPYGPNWMKVRPREYFGARIDGANYGDSQTNTAAKKAVYFRISGWDCTQASNPGVAGCVTMSSNTNAAFMQWDHNLMTFFQHTGGTAGSYNIFITDNIAVIGYTLNAFDCRVEGNWVTGTRYGGDGVDFACPNSVSGSNYSSISWNFFKGIANQINFGHSDYSQMQISTIGSLLPAIGNIDGPLEIGNIFYHGGNVHITDCKDIYISGQSGDYANGVGTCSGALNTNVSLPAVQRNIFYTTDITAADMGVTAFGDGQCGLRGNVNGLGQQFEINRIAGMVCVSTFQQAPGVAYTGVGSFLRDSTIVAPYFILQMPAPLGGLLGTNVPWQSVNTNVNAGGAVFTVENVLSQGSLTVGALAGVTAVTPAQSGNQFSLATDASVFTNSLNYTFTGTIQDVINHYSQSTYANKGAFSGRVRHRLRTYDASVITDPGLPSQPICTGIPTLSGTGTAGNPITATTPTYSGSPSSFQDVWLNAAFAVMVSPTNGTGATTSVFTPIAAGSYYYVQTATNAGGKGACPSAAFVVAP